MSKLRNAPTYLPRSRASVTQRYEANLPTYLPQGRALRNALTWPPVGGQIFLRILCAKMEGKCVLERFERRRRRKIVIFSPAALKTFFFLRYVTQVPTYLGQCRALRSVTEAIYLPTYPEKSPKSALRNLDMFPNIPTPIRC